MIKLKKILFESQICGAQQDENLYAQYHKTIQLTISQFLSKKYKKQPWRLADFSRIKKIWQDYTKMGIVRDESGLDDIVEILTENYLQLCCNTMLAYEVDRYGDMTRDQSYYFKKFKITTEKRKDKFWYDFIGWISDESDPRLTDNALPELGKHIAKLRQAKTYEEKILYCDAFLNVVHTRGDIADWFVDGGIASLDILAGKS